MRQHKTHQITKVFHMFHIPYICISEHGRKKTIFYSTLIIKLHRANGEYSIPVRTEFSRTLNFSEMKKTTKRNQYSFGARAKYDYYLVPFQNSNPTFSLIIFVNLYFREGKIRTYEDVSSGNKFYVYIDFDAMHSVASTIFN